MSLPSPDGEKRRFFGNLGFLSPRSGERSYGFETKPSTIELAPAVGCSDRKPRLTPEITAKGCQP
jgi:hypothetical protein